MTYIVLCCCCVHPLPFLVCMEGLPRANQRRPLFSFAISLHNNLKSMLVIFTSQKNINPYCSIFKFQFINFNRIFTISYRDAENVLVPCELGYFDFLLLVSFFLDRSYKRNIVKQHIKIRIKISIKGWILT